MECDRKAIQANVGQLNGSSKQLTVESNRRRSNGTPWDRDVIHGECERVKASERKEWRAVSEAEMSGDERREGVEKRRSRGN